MAFLITWTTYNSWLPGDERGFRTRKKKKWLPPPPRYAKDAEVTYDPERFKWLRRHYDGRKRVKLDRHQKETVMEVILQTIREFCPGRAVVSVGETHTHILVELGGKVTVSKFCNYGKGRSARKLLAMGHKGKLWGRGYHTQHIESSEWNTVRNYILRHSDENAVISELSERVPKPRRSSAGKPPERGTAL